MVKKYVLVEPSGLYFVNPSFWSWGLTKDIHKATTFNSYIEAKNKKEEIEKCRHAFL
jgi:hypothetical protein